MITASPQRTEPLERSSGSPMVDDLLAELKVRAGSAASEVRLIETHISWVLLASERPEVYKIKKSVNLGFLDFSSFEAREHACRTEVRINRRLAPRVYLGVVPVRRTTDGRFTFGQTGPIVDWAVRMRMLDESRRADRLLSRGELTRAHIDVIATRLAAFHAESPSTIRIARCAAPEAIARHVRDNFASLRETATSLVPSTTIDDLERSQAAFLADRRDVLERRMCDGAIRDGHGDLRLEHVFLSDANDGLEIIDGIEFDERYRYGDVCSDIAFLAMDLARLGRVDLSERFIAAYARIANDYDLYAVLDFYTSYRACVRAKIAAMGASGRWSPEPARAAAAGEARRYLRLAESARERPVIPPMLIAIGGGIATGKSTLAERLGVELSAPIVDADRTRKFMLGVRPTEHVGDGEWEGPYDPAFSRRVYDELLRRAGVVLASGRPVILDASFRSADARAKARALAAAHGVPFRFFECVAPTEICRARLASRMMTANVSDATPALLDSFTERFESVVELPREEHVRIETSGTGADPLEQAMTSVATWPHGLVD
jgi:aminoglycoside phosphotransferase family enzyme/predicted kinase